MSQEQPERPKDDRPIKYGDVFAAVKSSSEVAEKPVAPRDVAILQKAEKEMFGQQIKGAAALKMASATEKNEKAGFVGHGEATDVVADAGVSITQMDLPGRLIITEAIAGEVVRRFSQRAPAAAQSATEGSITIGEALEAAVLTAGNKPVEWSDAAAIQAAEVRATGRTNIMPGGVAASAQSAATLNARATSKEEKTTLADVLKGAASKLPTDKPATRKDAEGVTGAEMRNDPHLTTHPTGVAASVAAAARINQSK